MSIRPCSTKWLPFVLLILGALQQSCGAKEEIRSERTLLRLDQEVRLSSGDVLTGATQSINRYQSVLRKLDRGELELKGGSLTFRVSGQDSAQEVRLANIDLRYLVPYLPYDHAARPDAFDRANLFLSEYARNGVELSQEGGDRQPFGGWAASKSLFNDDEPFGYEEGKIVPNSGSRPRRIAITNNCLAPGLWEISASDNAGEMHHAWFEVPKETVFHYIRKANGLEASDRELEEALVYKKDLGEVPLDLDRLRTRVRTLQTARANLNPEKIIDGYSSQDSRRKVQRRFFSVVRDGRPIEVTKTGELRAGDVFHMFKFVPPGIYSKEAMNVSFDPDWPHAEIHEVRPRTRWSGKPAYPTPSGYIEIVLKSGDGRKALVIGNLPVDLLVFQADYVVPAFGAGILNPSDPIEQRYLVFTQGPAPYYAYLARVDAQGGMTVVNNHEFGYEQVFVRPVREGEEIRLKVILVAYERIVDLLELEVPLQGELAARIERASSVYHPPLFRTYVDSNTR